MHPCPCACRLCILPPRTRLSPWRGVWVWRFAWRYGSLKWVG